MIYVINHHSEYDPTAPTFRYYSEAVGPDSMQLYCAEDDETFDFLTKEDIVLLRSGDTDMVKKLIGAQQRIGFTSTIESLEVLNYAYDKGMAKDILHSSSVSVPRQYTIDEVKDGKVYFVKPRYGEGGRHIDEASLCRSREEVIKKCQSLENVGKTPMIEDFIDGIDCTVSVIRNAKTGDINTYAVDVHGESQVQTYECKKSFASCSPSLNLYVKTAAKSAFLAIGARHYLRIDFRIDKFNTPYLIDINVFPGFGMTELMHRSLMLVANKSYKDFINDVIESAD